MSDPKTNEPGGEPGTPMTSRDLFLGLVQSFQMAAMQQLGKVPSPATDQIERDLPHAKLSIDMLQMLKEKTAGNLTMEEVRFLDHVLTELRLHYVTETSKAPGGA